MCIIMLQQSMRSAIENLDLLVGTARSQTCAIWMKFNAIDHAGMICESLNFFTFVCNIPDSDSSVVTTRSNHSRVSWELRALYPVGVATEGLHELHVFNIPDFDCFIIRCWNQKFSIRIKFNGFNWCWMTFENLVSCWGIVVPDSNRGISWSTCEQCAIWINGNIVNWSLVTYKLISSRVSFETCAKNNSVHWGSDALFHAWCKDALCDFILVCPKGFH